MTEAPSYHHSILFAFVVVQNPLPIATSLFKLFLGDALPHGASAAHTSSYHLQQIINVVSSTPLLVRYDLTTQFHLGLLE